MTRNASHAMITGRAVVAVGCGADADNISSHICGTVGARSALKVIVVAIKALTVPKERSCFLVNQDVTLAVNGGADGMCGSACNVSRRWNLGIASLSCWPCNKHRECSRRC